MKSDKPRVLIVEDEPSLCVAYAKYFTRWGWDVVMAFTGDEALVRLGEHFDLITLDLKLPGVSGVGVLRTARERLVNAAVAVVASPTGADVSEEVSRLHPDRYFEKPDVFFPLEEYARELSGAFHARENEPLEATPP